MLWVLSSRMLPLTRLQDSLFSAMIPKSERDETRKHLRFLASLKKELTFDSKKRKGTKKRLRKHK